MIVPSHAAILLTDCLPASSLRRMLQPRSLEGVAHAARCLLAPSFDVCSPLSRLLRPPSPTRSITSPHSMPALFAELQSLPFTPALFPLLSRQNVSPGVGVVTGYEDGQDWRLPPGGTSSKVV